MIFTLTGSKELEELLNFQPRTKEDFQNLSTRIIEIIIKRLQGKPLYPSFVETFARELAKPLNVVEVRKVASILTTLANEKQREQKDKSSGKKKTKPVLGSSKLSTR
jgi:translation initiation factor 3 subunit J